MKLTGKCKEKFIFWMCNNHEFVRWHEYETMPKCAINALIIEFFDSGGHIGDETIIQILIDELIAGRSVLEATNAAIEKANEIFNLNNK